MKNIKNLKYYATTFLLTGLLTISGCESKNNEEDEVLKAYPIEVSQEFIPSYEIIRDYDINNICLLVDDNNNISVSEHFVTGKENISLSRLINYFGYSFDYDKDNFTINSKQLDKLVIDLVKEIHDMPSYIAVDDLNICSESNIVDGKLVVNTFFSDNIKGNFDKESFIEQYNDLFTYVDGKAYLSAIDYVLINRGNTYLVDLNEVFSNQIAFNEENIKEYTNELMEKLNIKSNNDKELFDANDIKFINNIFSKYDDNDRKEVIKEYIALNKDYISNDTYFYIINTYLPEYRESYRIEVEYDCIDSFKISNRVLSYTSNNIIKEEIENALNYINSESKEIVNVTVDKDLEKMCFNLLFGYNAKTFYELDNNSVENKIFKELLDNYYQVSDSIYYENRDLFNSLDYSNNSNLKRILTYLILNFNDDDNKEFNRFIELNDYNYLRPVVLG